MCSILKSWTTSCRLRNSARLLLRVSTRSAMVLSLSLCDSTSARYSSRSLVALSRSAFLDSSTLRAAWDSSRYFRSPMTLSIFSRITWPSWSSESFSPAVMASKRKYWESSFGRLALMTLLTSPSDNSRSRSDLTLDALEQASS